MNEIQPHQGIGPAGTETAPGIDAPSNVEAPIDVPAHEQAQALIPEHARVRKLSELDDGELQNRRSLAQVEMIYGQADIAKDPSTYRRWCKKNEWPNTVPLPVIKVDMGDGGSPLWLVHIRAIKERAFELSRRRDVEIDLNAGGSLTPVHAQADAGMAAYDQVAALASADNMEENPPHADTAMHVHAQEQPDERVHSDHADALREQLEARIADLKESLERERSDKASWQNQVGNWQEQVEALNKQLTNAQSNLELAMLKESRGDELNSGWQKLLAVFGLQKSDSGEGGVLVAKDATRLADSQLPDIESSRRIQ
jgi:hypothetical protein